MSKYEDLLMHRSYRELMSEANSPSDDSDLVPSKSLDPPDDLEEDPEDDEDESSDDEDPTDDEA